MKLFLAAAILLAASMPAGAQWLDRKTPNIPRKADGTPNLAAAAPRGPDGKPDLNGVWNGPAPQARPEPADLQTAVMDLARKHQQDYYRARPAYLCRPSGPEAEKFGGWKRILQTPTAIAILNDDLTYRIIHMDGRQLEANPAPSWTGYSVGRWDGDTLVVDSNGFNDKTWASRYGVTHTEALRVTERYRRSDFGHLQYEVTYTDPRSYTKPWSFKSALQLGADTEMLEAICEKSSEEWGGSLTDASTTGVKVPREVLAKYVGVYKGIYSGKERTYEVSLSGDALIATILGDDVEGGLGAAGLDDGAPRPLMALSNTVFEGLGLGYQFVVDDKGVATHLIVVHISGPYRYTRQK